MLHAVLIVVSDVYDGNPIFPCNNYRAIIYTKTIIPLEQCHFIGCMQYSHSRNIHLNYWLAAFKWIFPLREYFKKALHDITSAGLNCVVDDRVARNIVNKLDARFKSNFRYRSSR